MLLSSTLHKLRIVNLPRHDPTSSSSPTIALDSVRITSIAGQTGPGGRCHSPQMRKLRSAPARRGYSDLEDFAGRPSQNGDVAIDPVPTSFDLVPMHGVGVHAAEVQPVPSHRPFGSDTESVASTIAASLSSPPRTPLLKSVHAPAIALTISTGVDTSGHRVLTSRRRQSAPPSPTKCRKIKTAFGVGDEDDSSSLRSSSNTRSRTTLSQPPPSAQSDSPTTFFAATPPGDSPPSQLDSPSSPPHHFDPVHGTDVSHNFQLSKHPREHVPIKTFTPPPPLVGTSSPRLSTLSVLTRSSTLSSSSTTSSTTLSRSNSRLQSFARRRSTLKRFSLPNNTLSLPPLSPTITSERSPLERRFSSHVDTTTTGLERHASQGSSSGTCPSSPGFPPTPMDGSPLLPSPTSYFSSSADPSTLTNSPDYDLGSPPCVKPVRVSFDLPSPRLLRNASLKATAAAENETIPERSPTRTRSHTRSLSEGATTESARWTASPPIAWYAEEELHLTVTNPDLSASRPASSASSHPFHSLPFDSSSAPERRNFTSTPPPPLFIPAHEIGIAC